MRRDGAGMPRPLALPLGLSFIPSQFTGHGLGFPYLAAGLGSPWRILLGPLQSEPPHEEADPALPDQACTFAFPSARVLPFQQPAQPCSAPAKLGPRSQQHQCCASAHNPCPPGIHSLNPHHLSLLAGTPNALFHQSPAEPGEWGGHGLSQFS